MKKNFIYILILVVVAVITLVPGIRNFLKDQFLPVATIENAVHISNEDYDIELQGINVPSTNLKNFKDKGVSEDELRSKADSVQKLTDKYIKEIDQGAKDKEAEIMEI